MQRAFRFGLILGQCCLTACAGARPASDDDVLKHILAINSCNATMYIKQTSALLTTSKERLVSSGATPMPTPSYDSRGLRECFVATVPGQTLNPKVRANAGVLAVGRSCEKLIDVHSDSAMVDYNTCIDKGMTAALAPKRRV
jgi:hypothetical protein